MVASVVRLPSARRQSPALQIGRVPRRRAPNSAVRSREYLTPDEVESLISAARGTGRHGHRDATLILTAYPGTACASPS